MSTLRERRSDDSRRYAPDGQQALRVLTAGRTALIIAHRLSTIRHADRTLVLRDGRVVEEGHHADLLARGGTYADLWKFQSGELQKEEALR